MTQVPRETIYDDEDFPVEYGEKFYSPAAGLLIFKQGSDKWVKGDEIKAVVEQPTDILSDLGPDFTPVSPNDTLGWPLGRVSQPNNATS